MSAHLQTPKPGAAYWLLQLAGWYGVAAVNFAMPVLVLGSEGLLAARVDPALLQASRDGFRGVSLLQIFLEILLLHSAALALSHALRAYLHRHQWQALGTRTLLWRGALASLLLALPLALAQAFMSIAALRPELPGAPAYFQELQLLLNWQGLFAMWLVAYFFLIGRRRRRLAELRQSELARALQLAELRLLKSQLNPHFLFNALNTVRALIAEDVPRAQQAVTQLARTLRYTLGAGSGQQEEVTLAQELEIVDDYLALEALRLDQRLRIERDISPEARRARMPVMLLQTLVENAIKHGIAMLPDGGVLSLRAGVRDGQLQLEIGNPRPEPAASATGEGLGLRNSVERLRLLFGASAGLQLELTPGHALARVRIPVQGA